MANIRTQFISVAYLKQNTAISENMDDSKLGIYIIKAQETHLQQALGSQFYYHLSAAAKNNTLTSDEDTLIRDFIQATVAEFTLYEALPFISNIIANKSVTQESSEFGAPSDMDNVKYLRSNVLDLAQFYLKRLVTYLCDNSTLFPIFHSSNIKENLISDSKAYFSGVYIGNKSFDKYHKKWK